MVDITGLPKNAVLAALYNSARTQGLGILQYDPKPMTKEEAAKILNESKDCYFDYLKGRVMKVSLVSDEAFEERLYDRDNGNGAAQRVINNLRSELGM